MMIVMEIITTSILLIVGIGLLVGNHFMDKAVHNDTQTAELVSQPAKQTA